MSFCEKVRVHEGDVFDVEKCYDTVILDLWVKSGDSPEKARAMVGEMLVARAKFNMRCPASNVYLWGTRNRAINPAVEKEPCGLLLDIARGR